MVPASPSGLRLHLGLLLFELTVAKSRIIATHAAHAIAIKVKTVLAFARILTGIAFDGYLL